MPRMVATAKVVVDDILQGNFAERGLNAEDLDDWEVPFQRQDLLSF